MSRSLLLSPVRVGAAERQAVRRVRKRLRKKLHAKYVADVRYELSVSSHWRRKLFAAAGGTVSITPAALRLSAVPHRSLPFGRYPLRYLVAVTPLPNGLVEFEFRSIDFQASCAGRTTTPPLSPKKLLPSAMIPYGLMFTSTNLYASRVTPSPPNFTLKLVRPGFGSAAELPALSPA